METKMLTFHFDTFAATETPSDNAVKYGWNEGTAELTFAGETRRVRCLAPDANRHSWTVYGLCARYRTGAKVWPASLMFADGKLVHISTGFDNRSGRYSQPRLCGFTQDADKANVSKR
jgi:hypothetical protein